MHLPRFRLLKRWTSRQLPVSLSQSRLSRNQKMPIRFKNLLLWRRLSRKPLKKPTSKELLLPKVPILKPSPRSLLNLRLSSN
jgi:hypothetical protein